MKGKRKKDTKSNVEHDSKRASGAIQLSILIRLMIGVVKARILSKKTLKMNYFKNVN